MTMFADTDIGASAFSSKSVLEASFKQIKKEIDHSEATTRAWKRRYNTLSITPS
jgi:transposase